MIYTCVKYKNIIKRMFPDVTFSKGGNHYHYVSFCWAIGDKCYYMTTNDDRVRPNSGIIRPVGSFKDYTGGTNNSFDGIEEFAVIIAHLKVKGTL